MAQKIIISGCNGHMGRVVESICSADPEVTVVAGFDVNQESRDFPCLLYTSPDVADRLWRRTGRLGTDNPGRWAAGRSYISRS